MIRNMPRKKSVGSNTGTAGTKFEERENQRVSDEQADKQDLNQGMGTGTHDSTRHGVKWGRSYAKKTKATPSSSRRNK